MGFRKTAYEKLITKLKKLDQFAQVIKTENSFSIEDEVLLEYSESELKYGTKRFYPDLTAPLKEDSFSVTISLNQDNISLINSNPINPPKGIKNVLNIFKNIPDINIERVYLGFEENKIEGNQLYITKEFYNSLNSIDKEEGLDKRIRVFNRLTPFLNSEFNLDTSELETNRNYSLLLKEVLASGEFTQEDIIKFSESLELGEASQIVIEKQVNKQIEWLIDTIEEILEFDKITKPKSKELGKRHFNYTKVSVTGPEHLMEKILSDFGQYSLFGVPALLNTDKYVIHEGTSRSQFDLILINHLGDIEIVELKRPDQYLFEYGNGRGKFYPSKDLAIAISQTERYITVTNKDNDDDYKISGLKLRDFINEQIGNTIFVESIRPKGLIILGSWKKLCKDYEKLSIKTRNKVTKAEYENDCRQAYKELKYSLKNISIMTYSELLENARTRLELNK